MSQTQGNNLIALSASNNQIAPLVQDLFQDIDFKGISSAIDNIANHNKTLAPEEKEMAADLVDQWEADVVSRLNNKGHEMNQFIDFFKVKGAELRKSEQFDLIGYDMAIKTKTKKEHKALVDAIEQLSDLYDRRPDAPVEREDRTLREQLEEESQYKLDLAKHNIAEKKIKREIYLLDKKWKTQLLKNKEVNELLKKARHFTSNLHKFSNLCSDKSQIAKLNIAIANDDVRNSLRELLDFNMTI